MRILTVTNVAVFVMLVMLAVAVGGCTITTANDGEVGFRQCTSWGFYHTAKDTKSEASINTDVPSLEEWIKAQPEEPEEPTP